MKAPRRGAKPLAAFVPSIIEPLLATRGMSEATLISDWPAIIGADIARYVRPMQLQWPPRAAKGAPGSAAGAATLILRVESAFALEAQHAAGIIVARVNAHLGWRCVEKIAFRQGPLPKPEPKRRAPLAPSQNAEARARRAAADIEDTDLREAVSRLGARAIDRSERRRASSPALPEDEP